MPPASEGDYYPQISVNEPQVTDADPAIASMGSRARVNLFAFMEEVSAFASQAKNAGFLPPSNPFVEIGRLNAHRPIAIDGPNNGPYDIEVSEQEAGDLLFNIQVYVDLLEAQVAGAINLKTGVFNTAQLEHVSLSYIGLGSSGNPAVDLLALLPNADQIKKKKADEALAILNFSRRQPHVIFVADYSPNQDDGTQGAMICWKNMPDASGFIVNRHGILGNIDASFNVSMQKVKDNNRAYLDYAKAYVLTFYDQINSNNVSLFVDNNIPPDEYFIYTVQAYQNSKNSSTSLIPSNYIAIHLNNQQKQMILDEINGVYDFSLGFKIHGQGPQNGSPWPIIARQLFGDDSMDWILAATNIRAAIDRGDPIADVRSYSYLAANVNYIFAQSDAGKLVKPTNSDDLHNSINDALTTYGVLQTIESLLQESGILYYFDGVDPNAENTFKRAGTLDYSDSSLFAAVASAMDPENATINLRMLTTNLAVVLNNPQVQSYIANPDWQWRPRGNSKPSEITIIDPDLTTNTISESGIQFLSVLSALADSTVDLTTFEGISQLIRVIRLMSDYSPNRTQPPKQPDGIQLIETRPPIIPLPVTPPTPVDTWPNDELVKLARDAGKNSLADKIKQVINRQKEILK